MSDIDDLEEISDQYRFGVNHPARGMTAVKKMALRRFQRAGVKAQRSIEKQQDRSTDRRRIVVTLANQD